MNAEHQRAGWCFWTHWLLVTTLGWLTGFIGAFVLSAILMIVYPKETNALVGLCLGAGVSFMQWLFIMRRQFSPTGKWVLACAAGMGLPFIATVVVGEASGSGLDLSPNWIAGWIAAFGSGGLLTGLLQLHILRPRVSRPGWWVLASILGWVFSGLAFYGGYLAFVGGIPLGGVSGLVLVFLLR